MTTDPTDLRERIARVLTTTSRAEWPYTPGQEKWDHHKHGDQPGHTYSISCALCTGDVDRLADVLAAVLPPPADPAEAPLSPYYSHESCGFHWHGRDGMDIPMRDGQPVCPRCELRRLADEAQQQPTDRDVVEAHDAALSFTLKADGARPEPSVHGESVAHLASLHDDEHAVDARQPDGAHVCKPGASRYYCPTSGQTESDCHGGFNICCDRPDLHEPAVDARQDGAPS